MWAGEAEPGCIVVSGEKFGYNPDTILADGFALSWTTFTTVVRVRICAYSNNRRRVMVGFCFSRFAIGDFFASLDWLLTGVLYISFYILLLNAGTFCP